MNDENRHKREPGDADESVDQDGQTVRKKPKIPAFMLKPAVSKTVVDIEIEIDRRRKKRGW